ncbi:hypothetical protein NW752_006910 [Fusarium irregulare]|uniref:Uncharacterized protein n=1 Tax=Fusarium irregulare TaxID=2494466 RepID=A0A9W8PSS6_9HYPO|nr:hypothetical protein NW766_005790 [Fusarium irregulare]KAJ4015977.1 hypothetical protein NW752_006910 [Fusarium irregulare]
MASRENNPSTNDINILSGNGVSRAATVPPTAAPSPASIYGTVPAFVRELVLAQHDSGHLVPAPLPVSLFVAPPAAGPQDQITGLPGSSSGSAGSGRGNVPGRGRGFGVGRGFGGVRELGGGRGNSGQATPRVARDNSPSCGSGTIISNRPHDATVAARQFMKQTGSTCDSADRNPPEARMSLDIPRPRVSEVEDDTAASATAPVEQSAAEQEAAPKEENDQRGS